MSGEKMEFPRTLDEFMEQYKIVDTEQVYTNGTELVPIFRIKQWEDAHNNVVERKKGKWKRISNGTCSCSLCQFWIPNEQRHYANFCPNCGADMREEKTDAEIH